MKKIFFTITKTNITLFLSYFLCTGLYAAVESSQDPEKKDTTTASITVSSENSSSAEEEKSTTEKDQTKKEDSHPTEKVNQTESTTKETQKSEENKPKQEETIKQQKPIVNKEDKAITDKTILLEHIKQSDLFVHHPKKHYHKAKRNSFFTFYVIPDFRIYYNNFSLMMQVSLGKVIDLPNLVSTGFLEGEIGFKGLISEEEQILDLQLKKEINFIRNNGINSLIPGIDFPISLNIDGLGKSFATLSFNVGTGFYLKAFLSKNFTLIPRFGIKLNIRTAGFGYLKNRGNTLSLELGLGLRKYF